MEKVNPEEQNNSSTHDESSISANEGIEKLSYEDLLGRYIDGDESAFEQIFEHIGCRLFAFILRYIGNYTQAEDLYQDVCVKVAVKANTFSGRSSFMSWVFQIARNTCLDEIRTRGRKPKVSVEKGSSDSESSSMLFEFEDKSSPDPSDEIVRLELAKSISIAVEKLPDEQKEVFLLKEEGGLSFEDISNIVSCGKETAKSRMRYALERLRNSLGQEAKNYGLH